MACGGGAWQAQVARAAGTATRPAQPRQKTRRRLGGRPPHPTPHLILISDPALVHLVRPWEAGNPAGVVTGSAHRPPARLIAEWNRWMASEEAPKETNQAHCSDPRTHVGLAIQIFSCAAHRATPRMEAVSSLGFVRLLSYTWI